MLYHCLNSLSFSGCFAFIYFEKRSTDRFIQSPVTDSASKGNLICKIWAIPFWSPVTMPSTTEVPCVEEDQFL